MSSKSFWDHPIEKIEEALSIRKQIAALQAKLGEMFDGAASKLSVKTGKRGGKRTMSPATIAKMRAAQQARWAKKKGTAPTTSKAATAKVARKKKRKLSPEGRARIVAALKARHAAKKAAAK